MVNPHPIHTAASPPFSWTDPAWIGALATAGLFVFAIVTAVFAALAYLQQKAEVALLQQQAARDIEGRRKAQASNVFVSAFDVNDVRVRNTSEQPIYTVQTFYAGNRELFDWDVVAPKGEVYVSRSIADADGKMPTITLEFTDAAGVRWRTTTRGGLTEAPATAS